MTALFVDIGGIDDHHCMQMCQVLYMYFVFFLIYFVIFNEYFEIYHYKFILHIPSIMTCFISIYL
jgi:hypothetical protein